MFCHTNYDPPPAGASYRIVRVPSTAESTIPIVSVQKDEDTSISYPVVIRQEITVIEIPEIEILEPRPRPVRKPAFQPPVREIAAPWQARWRLTQQRPRDGLR